MNKVEEPYAHTCASTCVHKCITHTYTHKLGKEGKKKVLIERDTEELN